jgi:ABC-type lipoprotein release transport system permease subunit
MTGAAIGLSQALVVTQLLSAFLYGVNPRDPATLVAVVTLIAGVACAAAWLPARRAGRQDSLVTLRDA